MRRDDKSMSSRVPIISLPDPTRLSVTAWLRELPLANTAYSSEALAGTLESFNERAGLSAMLRFELAELLRPAVLVVAQRMETHFIDSSLPYSADAEFYIRRGLGLHRELQLAYVLPCFDPVFGEAGAKGDGRLGPALYRAFQQAGMVLLRTTQLYRRPDENYWALLYRLYRIAETRNLLSTRFEDAGEPESCKTAEGAFKRCLLFYLANSRRLRQRDMAQVYASLGRLGGSAYFGTNIAYDGHPAEFAVHLEGGCSPFRAQALTDGDLPGLRFLCTRELAQVLIEPLVADPGGVAAEPPPDKPLLLRLARSLGAMEKRRSKRWPDSNPCQYVIGLPGLVAALSQLQAGEASSRPPKVPADFRSEFARERPYVVEWRSEGLSGGNQAAPAVGDRGLKEPTPGHPRFQSHSGLSSEDIWYVDPAAASAVVVEGKTLNSSPRGYCIVRPATPAARTKVGELIGIRSDETLFIGAIRWLECLGDSWRFGVELLTPSAHVVELGDSASEPQGKALLLPIEPVLRTVPELLVMPGRIRVGDILGLRSGSEVARYRVRELLEGTPSFVRFGLLPAEARPEPG